MNGESEESSVCFKNRRTLIENTRQQSQTGHFKVDKVQNQTIILVNHRSKLVIYLCFISFSFLVIIGKNGVGLNTKYSDAANQSYQTWDSCHPSPTQCYPSMDVRSVVYRYKYRKMFSLSTYFPLPFPLPLNIREHFLRMPQIFTRHSENGTSNPVNPPRGRRNLTIANPLPPSPTPKAPGVKILNSVLVDTVTQPK